MLNVEENDNMREKENTITPSLFVWILFSLMCSCVSIFLHLFVMLVLLSRAIVPRASNKK